MNNLKTSTAGLIALFIFVIGFVCGFAVSRKWSPCVELPVVNIVRDTVIVRDTIRGVVQPPKVKTVIRVDTVRLQISPVNRHKYEATPDTTRGVLDTISGARKGKSTEVLVPITSTVYATKNYRAVVTGFRATLDSMEVYRDTRTITETVTKLQPPKRKWLALSVGPSVGYNLSGEIVPSLSATLGIILISK